MKECKRCEKGKDEAEFARDRSKADGLQDRCRACHAKYRRSLRKRKEMAGRKIKTANVEAKLVTMALCPHCGNQVYHVVKD